MEPDTRDSSLDNGNTDIDSGAELQDTIKEDFVEKDLTGELYMEPVEYYHIQWYYQQRKVIQLKLDLLDREMLIKQLQAKVASQEATILATQGKSLKDQDEKIKKEVKKIHTQVCERLGLETLDNYLVDDGTFKLTHEDDLA